MGKTLNMLTLHNGNKIPKIGLGTWNSEKDLVKKAVETALENGYRHIDCAKAYENELEVGAAIKNSKVDRHDIFITSKLWNTNHRPENVEKGLKSSLDNLQVKYLDLFLMHWPIAFEYQGEDEMEPLNFETFQIAMDDSEEADFLKTWKEMERLYKEGKVRNIGVSNFNLVQLKKLVDNCEIIPHVLQIEVHPYFQQKEMIDYCKETGIVVTGYSPLGSPGFDIDGSRKLKAIENEVICGIAKRLDKTPAQVMIKWALQRGICVVPKSVTHERIDKNNVLKYSFGLSNEDMDKINGIDVEEKVVNPTWWSHS